MTSLAQHLQQQRPTPASQFASLYSRRDDDDDESEEEGEEDYDDGETTCSESVMSMAYSLRASFRRTGNCLFEPNDAKTLADTLEPLLLDPRRMAKLGRNGRQAVEQQFTVKAMAEKVLDVYARVADANMEVTKPAASSNADAS